MTALKKGKKEKKLKFHDFYSAELEALEIAYNRFNNISEEDVEPELLDAAMFELKAAELKLEVAARQAKAAARCSEAEEYAVEKRKKSLFNRLFSRENGILETLSAAFKGFFASFPWIQKAGSE